MTSVSYFLIGFNPKAEVFSRFLLIMTIFSANCGLYCLIIGLAISNPSTSTLFASISMLFQMLFAGILVNQVQIPPPLRWLQYLSFFKYAYEACVANDAAGLKLEDKISGVNFSVPASLVLERFGLDVNAYYRDMLVCIGLFFGFLMLIGVLIKYKIREMK
jgi:ABC-type multidrug transport system permease subunit